MRTPDDLRALVEEYLGALPFAGSANGSGVAEAVRYGLGGGKRLRPVLCLAVGEALGVEVEELLPGAAAVELVHAFSLVHDDLPALDDDASRRGRPSAHVQFGEAVAILAGDALLVHAFRLAAGYPAPAAARVLAHTTLGMIDGQYLDVTGGDVALRELHRLKTAQLFGAAVGVATAVAGLSEPEDAPWREFAESFGLLFQAADDLADGDGAVAELGADGTRALAADHAAAARAALERTGAETRVVSCAPRRPRAPGGVARVPSRCAVTHPARTRHRQVRSPPVPSTAGGRWRQLSPREGGACARGATGRRGHAPRGHVRSSQVPDAARAVPKVRQVPPACSRAGRPRAYPLGREEAPRRAAR